MRKLILQNRLSPGDVLAMTAAVESLHTTYPDDYLTDVDTSTAAIWQHNPRVTSMGRGDAELVPMEYPSIHHSNQRHTPFLAGYVAFLAEYLGQPLELTVNRPYLYLAEQEKQWLDQIRDKVTQGRAIPFWLLSPGLKGDFTAKSWPVEHYQRLVDLTAGRLQWVQIGARGENNPKLAGVIDLVGQTDHRELIRLAWHASGGLGPVTYLQHICAAWQKPYVCLLGGREPMTWTSYPLQHTLHTIGRLWCCHDGACWKSRVMPLKDNDHKDTSLCEWPVLGMARPAPKCLAMITPEEVAQLVLRLAV